MILGSQPLQTSYSHHIPQVCHSTSRALVLFQEAPTLLSRVPEAVNTKESRTPRKNSCTQPSSDQVHGLNNFETSSCTIIQWSSPSALVETYAVFPRVQEI